MGRHDPHHQTSVGADVGTWSIKKFGLQAREVVQGQLVLMAHVALHLDLPIDMITVQR